MKLIRFLTKSKNAEIGYAYDWIRQRKKSSREKIKKYSKMKKRISKLSKNTKSIRLVPNF